MRKISLAAARVDAGLTQAELAEKIGVSRESVRCWETGKKDIRKAHFIAFCAVTGFNEDEIFLPKELPERVRVAT